MSRLVSLAAAIDGPPSMEQIDAMLVELRQMPRDENVMKLIDDLLDCRALLEASPQQ